MISPFDISEAALFKRAVADAVEAMLQRATIGRSIPDAIVALDRLRQQFEIQRTSHDRSTIRIRLRPR